ncbi:DUF1566 domain-containing protein [Labilibaculum sp.]|uniref:Lcl C-terminal domain-containing protein n=1 Tax=Labilibaculum sp. TaxID=2060723 RepID=UPI003562175D
MIKFKASLALSLTVLMASTLTLGQKKESKFSKKLTYPLVDTKQNEAYNNSNIIALPSKGEEFYGQDACYQGNQPSYTDNGDGTITDKVTGLMWEKDMGSKVSPEEALQKSENSSLAGYTDWRIPSIKELYSLIIFTGQVKGAKAIDLFIDTDYFNQPLGDPSLGEREIDAQTASSTEYIGKTMNGDETIFGVNFIDGRIKGYPKYRKRTGAIIKRYFRLVRGNNDYGKNNIVDNGDGTVSDYSTGLMWQKSDDGIGRNWEESLAYAENLKLSKYTDWRLPNAKELQSIVDYSRSPQTSSSPAINPLFATTEITDPNGKKGQYPFFWTSTTHLDGRNPYSSAVYIAFGEGQGKMRERLMDVHGAGCQRSDPKSGDKNNYPQFFGPQGDVRYVYNYTRAVRNIDSK